MTYEAFRGSGLDLSAVGFMPGGEAYFCTPVGAAILGRAGVDGIHLYTMNNAGVARAIFDRVSTLFTV